MKLFKSQFFKLHWPKFLSIFLFILLFSAYINIFGFFTPGETLDPTCLPGVPGCTVQISSTDLSDSVNLARLDTVNSFSKTINLRAGSTAAGTAPLKFTSGSLLSMTEAGSIEFDGNHLYLSMANGGPRYQLDQQSGAESMVYPSPGIPVSTGAAWAASSITDNSTNWNTAYSQTRQWDGGNTGLVPATGRTSLGLGTAALSAIGDFVSYRTFGTAAGSDIGAFATSAQGTLANSAVQGTPWTSVGYLTSLTGAVLTSDIGTTVLAQRTFGSAAGSDIGAFATSAQGTLANSAVQGTPWTSEGYYIGDGSAFATSAQGSLANTALQSLSGAWLLNGNTNGAKKTLGSIDNYDIGFITNNTERLTVLASGNVGIGTTTPDSNLSIGTGGNTSVQIGFADSRGVIGYDISYGAAGGMYIGTGNNNGPLLLNPVGKGNVGIGTTTPTAVLQLKASIGAVNTAPLKLTSGINLTTTEAGAIEYDGLHLYFTAVDSGTRYQLDQSSPITVVNNSNLFSTGLLGTGARVTTATNSNFLGQYAGNGASFASNSNFLGSDAGRLAASATGSNFLGTAAGQQAGYASYSNFLGYAAGSGAVNASKSNFLGVDAGNFATNASNSIFIGQNAGFGDTVNNTGSLDDWSILLGYNTRTGGNKNSILLGGSDSSSYITNTKANQFMLAPTVTEMRLRSVDYTLPSAQATASGQVLTNNGSGVLTWAAAGGGGTVTGTGNTNEIAYFTGTSAIGSLGVATYPSLTELSYIKGVTSAIQTQLNGKQASGSYLTANQTITLGGILSGSGTTSITANAASGYYMPSTTDQTNWNGKQAAYTILGTLGGLSNSSGVLTNDSSGGLTWAAGGGLATNIAGGLGGQILFQSAVDTTAKLPNGTAGQILTSNGTILPPSWGDPVVHSVFDTAGIENFRAQSGTNVSWVRMAVFGGLSLYDSRIKFFNQDQSWPSSSTIGGIDGVDDISFSSGSDLQIAGGNAWASGGYNGNGGDLYLNGGNKDGSGKYGDVILQANNGNVGIGTTTPGYTLTVAGTAWVTSGLWSASDSRWKTNVQPITSSLDKVMQLTGVSYNWDQQDYPQNHFDSATHLGFIAQDVRKVVPDLVTIGTDGYMGVDYNGFAPLVVQAIQELNLKLESVNTMEQENSFRSILISWFGNVGNGIGNIFAGTFKAKDKLCINETCVTESQLQSLLANANVGGNGGSGNDGGDTIAPVITLVGSTPINIDIDGVYADVGATAVDNVDGDITNKIKVTGLPIDTSLQGIFTIHYNVADVAGNNATEVTRVVNVGGTTILANTPPAPNTLTCVLPEIVIDGACAIPPVTPPPPTCTGAQILVNNICTDPIQADPTCTAPQILVNHVCTDQLY